MMVSMMMTMVGRSLCLSEFPQLTDMPVIADEGFVDYDSDYDMKGGERQSTCDERRSLRRSVSSHSCN